MLRPPTKDEKEESFEAMLDRPRMLTPPAVDEEGECPEATVHGPGVLTPDEEVESPEVILDGPGTLTSPRPEAMEDAKVVATDEILEVLDTVREGVGGCPKCV